VSEPSARVLLIGYGNPGRGDDGLGPALAEAMEKLGLAGVTVDSNYQLVVEDAEAVAHYPVVVFADADAGGPEPFSFRTIEPQAGLGFTSHHLDPRTILAMAQELFGAQPEGYLLGIRGYQFDPLQESLSPGARSNLEGAVNFFQTWWRQRSCLTSAGGSEFAARSGKEET